LNATMVAVPYAAIASPSGDNSTSPLNPVPSG
jgi:hypothetical protein